MEPFYQELNVKYAEKANFAQGLYFDKLEDEMQLIVNLSLSHFSPRRKMSTDGRGSINRHISDLYII